MTDHRRIIGLLAAFAAALAAPLASQEGARFGVLNSQEVLEKSVEGKKAYAQLQEADTKYKNDLTGLDEQIKQIEGRLAAQRLTLTGQALQGLQADLDRKRTERKRLTEDAVKALQQLQFQLFERIEGELMPLIERIRKDKGLDVVFDLTKGGAVTFNPAIDITAELIRLYDASKAAPPDKSPSKEN